MVIILDSNYGASMWDLSHGHCILELEEALCCSELLFSGLAHRHEQILLLVMNNTAHMMGPCQLFT